MTVLETAKITSKGQITIPNRIRKLLRIQAGASVAFGVSREGILMLPCKVTTESPYTPVEWEKIEKLSCVKGKTYRSPKRAKKHIEAL